MPIYAYKCSACGHQADVLQKMADAPLTVCPSCGAAAYAKQLTAPGFALKGNGWYATDFKGGGKAANESTAVPASSSTAATETKAESKSDAKAAAKVEAAPAAQASGSGGSGA